MSIKERSAQERWDELVKHLSAAVGNRNWLLFDRLLTEARQISDAGKLANLMIAIFDEEEVS